VGAGDATGRVEELVGAGAREWCRDHVVRDHAAADETDVEGCKLVIGWVGTETVRPTDPTNNQKGHARNDTDLQALMSRGSV
jgi:hypothetical protein